MSASSRVVLVLVSVAVFGCGCGGITSDDAGQDAGTDAGRDGGRDTGPHDAGIDAAEWDGGGWVAAAEVPSGCELYFASAALIRSTTFSIVPCPDRVGCREMTRTSGRVGPRQFLVDMGHGVHDGARGLFVAEGDLEDGWTEAWVIADDGSAVIGARSRPVTAGDYCSEVAFDVSATDFALDLQRGIHPDGDSEFLYRADLGTTPQLVADLRSPFAHGGVQEIRLDELRTAAWLSTQLVEAAEIDGTLTTLAPPSGECEIADVVGDAIFTECSGPTNVYVQLPGGAVTPLFDPTGRSYGLDSDGTDMAWLRYTLLDGGYQAALWTAPHTTDRSSVHERLVAQVPPDTTAVQVDVRVGFGYAAVLERVNVLGVYRLSDGARAEIDAPAGENWTGFVQYIGPEEIAATSGVPDVSPPTSSALMFIRLDSLTFVTP